MENQEKINFKKIYKSNKKQMIKIEKGKIVGLDLIANIKDLKTDFIFNLEIEFNQDTSIQKMIANQGILLPYKFSKMVEKIKLRLIFLSKKNVESSKFFDFSYDFLAQWIDLEVKKILNEDGKNYF
jgi:uncharacterized membrane protein